MSLRTKENDKRLQETRRSADTVPHAHAYAHTDCQKTSTMKYVQCRHTVHHLLNYRGMAGGMLQESEGSWGGASRSQGD